MRSDCTAMAGLTVHSLKQKVHSNATDPHHGIVDDIARM